MPTTNLIVDGTTYSQSGRKTNSLVLDAWGWDLDGDSWCEFHEVHRGPTPKYAGPKAVSITVDGTARFTGDISTCQPGMDEGGRRWAYRCLGFKYRANQLPVVATDGSGVMVYNLPAEDEWYVAANSGKSVGDIIAAVLTAHSAALTAIGITTDATTTAQLAALTLVPQDRVYVTGERLWMAIDAVQQRWARNHRLVILPSGLVRLVDVTTGTTRSFNSPGMASPDPIDPPQWARDWTHCGTRVVVRGSGRIRPAYVSLVGLELQETWSGADEAAWSWNDFAKPLDAYDKGTVNSVLGSTSVRITSSDATRTWAVNFWSGRKAWIYLKKTAGSGLQYQEAAPVTSCTALTAAGTSDLTLGLTLDNQAVGAYDSYELIGRSAPAGVGRVNVYRLYDVVTPGNWIEQHLVPRFPAEVPFVGYTGLSVQNTLTPVGQVIGPSGNGFTQTFRILPATGQILFDRPTVEGLNQQSVLDVGGVGVTQPADIYCLLAYSRGALTATYPADVAGLPVYAGTAYTAAGLSRTLYADIESWLYEGASTAQVDLAQMIHGSVADSIIEGTVRYRGAYSNCYDPSGGHIVSTAELDRYTGGTVTTAVPLRAFTLRYDSSGGPNWMSEMRCSSRRDPRTDESQYLHLSQFGSGGVFAGGVSPFGGNQVAAQIDSMLAGQAQQAAGRNQAMTGFYGNPGSDAVSGMGAAGAGASGDFSSAAASGGSMGDAASSVMGGMMAGGSTGDAQPGQSTGGVFGGATGAFNSYRRKRRRPKPRPGPTGFIEPRGIVGGPGRTIGMDDFAPPGDDE